MFEPHKDTHPETLCVHGGRAPENVGTPRAAIHRTTAYEFNNAEHAARIFALEEEGFGYSRIANPTQAALEHRLAVLEGGVQALALSSGQAATLYSILTICGSGDQILASNNLYGGSLTLFTTTLRSLGIDVLLVDPRDTESFNKGVTEKTKLFLVETMSNPDLRFTDIESVAAIAKSVGVPLIVDSTFTPPTIFRPFEHGADIVIHSLSKWISGHGTIVAGTVIDGGSFDWSSGRFPQMTDPDPSYHGLRFIDAVTDTAPSGYINRMRTVVLRNTGACISPDTASLALLGVETLALRMERHCENALGVAIYLADHPRVEWVRYPGLPNDPQHALASRYLKSGFGGVVSFGIRGGKEEAFEFINRLKLPLIEANVGDTASLVVHPASTTHAQLTKAEREAAGVPENMIRLSVGIEHLEDIITDISQALGEI